MRVFLYNVLFLADFKEHSKLDHVFYIFVANDLRNIYENQLFNFKDDIVGEPTAPDFSPIIDFIRQCHICYLAIDSYARVKASLARETYKSNALNKKIAAKFESNLK